MNYITLRHSIEKCVSIEKLRICVHAFENILYSHNLPNKNAVKLWYSTLNDSTGDQFDVCAKKWARDLHKREEELSWNGIWKNARQPFRCIKNKLRQFKILNRLYYTPSKLFTMGLQEDSKCLKCGYTDGTLFHLLWDCHKIKEIWFGITKHAMNHINITIPLTPESCILGDLHNFNKVPPKDKKVFLSLCMITKKVINNNWICTKTPPEREWVTEAMEAVSLEKVAFSLENNDAAYVEIWAPMENYLMSL